MRLVPASWCYGWTKCVDVQKTLREGLGTENTQGEGLTRDRMGCLLHWGWERGAGLGLAEGPLHSVHLLVGSLLGQTGLLAGRFRSSLC